MYFGNLKNNKFIRFSFGGILSYSINIAVTYILTSVFGLYYFYSYLIAFSIVILFNFIFSLKIIFSVQGKILNRFIRYIIFLAIFSLTSIYAVKYFTEVLSLYYLISITVVTVSMFLVKYFVYKRFVFFDQTQDILL